jgi:glycosyltransferase involved in cell wall biosynthesis
MRLAIVIDNLDMGGAQHLVYELVKNIDKSEFDVKIICFFKTNSLLEREMLDRGYNIKFLNKKVIKRRIYLMIALLRTLFDFKPDIVHAHMVGICAVFYTLLNSMNIITTIHTIPNKAFKKFLSKMIFLLSITLHKNIVVAISRVNFDLIKSTWKIKEKHLRYVNNGISISEYYSKEHALFSFINVSRQDENKNQALIVRAFARLCKENIPIKLYLVGDGDKHHYLKELSEKLDIGNHIEFTGYIASPKEYFAISDVYISSAHWEGLPLSILEAMAAGLPIIATDVGGVRDVVQENGVLIADDDEDALFAAMKQLFSNRALKEYKGKKSKELVWAYSSENMAKQYGLIYKEFAGKNK